MCLVQNCESTPPLSLYTLAELTIPNISNNDASSTTADDGDDTPTAATVGDEDDGREMDPHNSNKDGGGNSNGEIPLNACGEITINR